MIELLLLLAVVDKIFAIMPLTSTFIVAELVSVKSPEIKDLSSCSRRGEENELAWEFEFFLDEEYNTTDDADLALEALDWAVEDDL